MGTAAATLARRHACVALMPWSFRAVRALETCWCGFLALGPCHALVLFRSRTFSWIREHRSGHDLHSVWGNTKKGAPPPAWGWRKSSPHLPPQVDVHVALEGHGHEHVCSAAAVVRYVRAALVRARLPRQELHLCARGVLPEEHRLQAAAGRQGRQTPQRAQGQAAIASAVPSRVCVSAPATARCPPPPLFPRTCPGPGYPAVTRLCAGSAPLC